jgi:hypothetical protein
VSDSFQFIALPSDRFASLFGQSNTELQSAGILRMIVDEKPGYPCRVSLTDAEVGETVLLLTFAHLDVSSPYRSSGPIIVRNGAATARPAVGEIPAMFAHRLLSVRAYDATDMMIDSEVVKGIDIERAILRLFAGEHVSYLHIHNAQPGCYNCAVVRA